MKLLGARIDALLTAGNAVPPAERAEYQELVERLEQSARRRIGTKQTPRAYEGR